MTRETHRQTVKQTFCSPQFLYLLSFFFILSVLSPVLYIFQSVHLFSHWLFRAQFITKDMQFNNYSLSRALNHGIIFITNPHSLTVFIYPCTKLSFLPFSFNHFLISFFSAAENESLKTHKEESAFLYVLLTKTKTINPCVLKIWIQMWLYWSVCVCLQHHTTPYAVFLSVCILYLGELQPVGLHPENNLSSLKAEYLFEASLLLEMLFPTFYMLIHLFLLFKNMALHQHWC